EALAPSDALDPEPARWGGVRDRDAALAVFDTWKSILSLHPPSVHEEMARLERLRPTLGPLVDGIAMDAAEFPGCEDLWPKWGGFDRGKPEDFALLADAAVRAQPELDPAALADEAAALREREPSAAGKRALAFAEANLRVRATQPERALVLARPALR